MTSGNDRTPHSDYMERAIETVRAIRSDIARTVARGDVEPAEMRALLRAERIARLNARRAMHGKPPLAFKVAKKDENEDTRLFRVPIIHE